jgi:fumarylacetoacetase
LAHLPVLYPLFYLVSLNKTKPVKLTTQPDFSCSLNHVRNAGRAILNDPSPPPGFFHFPIGYAGRASTIVVSGTPITRPNGHFYDHTNPTPKTVIYGPSRALDYEMELGVVIGRPLGPGNGVNAKDAEGHVFGFVVLNDWSGMLSFLFFSQKKQTICWNIC